MTKKPLILVVEDDRQQSDLVLEIINETQRFQAIAAYDGQQALEILKPLNGVLISLAIE